MKSMLSRSLWVLAVVGLLMTAGCGGPAAESQKEPFDEAKATQELSAAMAVWLPDNADKVADQLGMWVALGTAAGSNDLGTAAVRPALLGELEITVTHVEAARGTDSYKGTVSVSFPITLRLSLGSAGAGSTHDSSVDKEYVVTVSFDVTVTGGEVVEASPGYDVDVNAIKE
jgi:hypothetical protein